MKGDALKALKKVSEGSIDALLVILDKLGLANSQDLLVEFFKIPLVRTPKLKEISKRLEVKEKDVSLLVSMITLQRAILRLDFLNHERLCLEKPAGRDDESSGSALHDSAGNAMQKDKI